jgi:hypothetical protein
LSVTEQVANERAGAREQTRARYPDEQGYIERDGVRVFYEVYGDGEPTLLFCPTWTIVHSRIWKMQIPYFALCIGPHILGPVALAVAARVEDDDLRAERRVSVQLHPVSSLG